MIYMDGMQKYFQTSYRAEAGLINKSVKTNNIIGISFYHANKHAYS